MKIITLKPGVARFTQRVLLDGSEFILSFDWNSRAAKWSMSVADAGGTDLVTGLRLVCGLPLLRLVSDARRPPGDFFLLDRTGEGDPVLSDLGTRVFLVYVEAGDL